MACAYWGMAGDDACEGAERRLVRLGADACLRDHEDRASLAGRRARAARVREVHGGTLRRCGGSGSAEAPERGGELHRSPAVLLQLAVNANARGSAALTRKTALAKTQTKSAKPMTMRYSFNVSMEVASWSVEATRGPCPARGLFAWW